MTTQELQTYVSKWDSPKVYPACPQEDCRAGLEIRVTRALQDGRAQKTCRGCGTRYRVTAYMNRERWWNVLLVVRDDR